MTPYIQVMYRRPRRREGEREKKNDQDCHKLKNIFSMLQQAREHEPARSILEFYS
jgi:hypothetical protein